jgi:opacity protein-like surface antigen
VIALAWGTAVPAHADGIFGGFVGTAFGGSFGEFQDTLEDASRPLIFGGVLGGVRPRGLGFEIDFGYSPDFFGTEDLTGSQTSVTTVMGNLVIGGAASNGVAPYISGGVGLIRTNVEDPGDLLDNLTTNDFGFNVGGGLNMMFGSNFGVRGDIRYFRSFAEEDEEDGRLDLGVDLGDFSFWRGSAGLIVRW